ncbi:THAP domain-containing protein 1 B-like [Coregonus clupeaformis]|uniref:THAP domain-containing protein 1 B-like n=1 Tax=Coregonus clupeaformis TaxID=59861 RepID=UPI001E1C43C5|nr:THAP domain-containing protein 1 B-like [Coregonus clupeaformis]
MARPSWCTVPGCCFYRKSMATGNAFHRYPVKDPERCKRWLIAVRHIKYDVKTPVATLNSLRVCSKHFREDDYERDFQAEMMGTKNKRSLKDTAVPSVFPWTGPAVPKYRGAFEKRKRAEVLASIEGLNRTSKVNQPVTTTSSSAIYAVGGTVSQPRLDREQLLDDTGSLTVKSLRSCLAVIMMTMWPLHLMERKSFCPQRRNLRNPRRRRRGKTRRIVQMSGSRLIKKIL